MSELLSRVLKEASQLSAADQDALAERWLEELNDEQLLVQLRSAAKEPMFGIHDSHEAAFVMQQMLVNKVSDV